MSWPELRALMRLVRASGSHQSIGYFCDGRGRYRLRIRDVHTDMALILEHPSDWEDLPNADDAASG